MNAFRERLFKAKDVDKEKEAPDDEEAKEENVNTTKADSFKAILTHKLEVDDEIKQKVIDANVADNERYGKKFILLFCSFDVSLVYTICIILFRYI